MNTAAIDNKASGWVYDLETLSNCFTGVFYNIQSKETKSFVIHEDRNDFKQFYQFLQDCISNGDSFLGYNNLFFDSPIIDFILIRASHFSKLSPSAITAQIYNKAQNLIQSQNDEGTGFKSKSKPKINQVDVFTLMHYNRRRVGLKTLQGSMRWWQMQDMPIHHASHITESQIDDILEYNVNDVMSTYEFYTHILSEINLRKIISKLYGFNAINMSSTKIGETIFINALVKATGKSVKELKKLVEKNQVVDVSTLIFDRVCVTEAPFVAIKEYLEKQKITTIKGSFTDIDIGKNEKLLLPYISKHKDYYFKKKNLLKKLNVVHYDNTFVVGAGGLDCGLLLRN